MKGMRLYALRVLVVGSLGVLCSYNCMAQENAETEAPFRPHHQLGLVLSHAHVFEGRDAEGKRKILSLPAWGLDYNWCFHPKWAIGLHTDIIIEKFEVAKNLESGGHEEVIERSYPVAPAIMGIYKPGGHWSFLLGVGGEFAKEEDFLLSRAAIEYSGELPRGWEVTGSLSYDFKWNAYDTWILGIGITKLLGKHHKK